MKAVIGVNVNQSDLPALQFTVMGTRKLGMFQRKIYPLEFDSGQIYHPVVPPLSSVKEAIIPWPVVQVPLARIRVRLLNGRRALQRPTTYRHLDLEASSANQ